jgi:hypothetical protein
MWVTGLFAAADDAEGALDNLDEADFGSDSVSVVAADPHAAAALSDAPGPLGRIGPEELLAHLAHLGLAPAQYQTYADALAKGAVCLVVFAPTGSEQSAAEILADQKASHVQILFGDRK